MLDIIILYYIRKINYQNWKNKFCLIVPHDKKKIKMNLTVK
jgi:hypothetical protein